MRLERQSVFAIVAMLLFSLGMGFMWIMTHGFGESFGVGFAVGGLFGMALTFAAVGWRRPEALQSRTAADVQPSLGREEPGVIRAERRRP